ncbi:uncharacterized protein [Physcomitrium patens]|uniref:Uncharacterized protein n=1 Tax=Physcomitrium patens TaxID=3218 RepID=A0A2K1KIX7_PHYPA|nr:uncharacterized protein LOC112282695 [Physcomitrium patens]PNR53736.1 hypothetical protein PHYPA_007411 [Physcomitrium patens]|eukprot:XP_024376425.1 uncharacterized protein LOC112282695 [Physcomitrella patens]
MATLALPSLKCPSSSRLFTAGAATLPKASLPCADFLLFRPLPWKLTNATRLGLKNTLGKIQRRKWSCQAGSADQNETVAIGETPKQAYIPDAETSKEVKSPDAETQKQGPPVLTIIAGIVVAALVFWGLWSAVSAIARLFIR